MKKSILFAGAVILFGAAIYGGMVWGYLFGGNQYYGRMAPGDAVSTMATLQKLRSGKIDEGISLLETQLDILILNYCSFDPEIDDWLGIFQSETKMVSAKLMTQIAKYRENHPSQFRPFKICEETTNHF